MKYGEGGKDGIGGDDDNNRTIETVLWPLHLHNEGFIH